MPKTSHQTFVYNNVVYVVELDVIFASLVHFSTMQYFGSDRVS